MIRTNIETIRNFQMSKMTARETSHIRVRIEPKLLGRLERSREKNGQTLTGEIVKRLERSFEKEDRVALVREAFDHAPLYERFPVQEMAPKRDKQRPAEVLTDANVLVHVLLGSDALKSEFLRLTALEVARMPAGELEHGSSLRQLADRVLAEFEKRRSEDQ